MFKKLLPSFAAAFLALVFFSGSAYAGASSFMDVYFEENGSQIVMYKTKAATVADFLNEIGLKLNEKDELNVLLGDRVRDEMKITLKRGFPIVVWLDGVATGAWAKENYAIGNLIAELKAKTGVQYFFDAPLNTRIVAGTEYVLSSERFAYLTESFLVPYEVYIYVTPDLPAGEEVVMSYGEPGVRNVTYKARYLGAKEDSREFVSVETVKEPTAHVVYCGVSAEEFKLLPEQNAEPAASVISEHNFEPAANFAPKPKIEPAVKNTPELKVEPDANAAPEQVNEPADGSEPDRTELTVDIEGETYDFIAEFDMSASAYTAASSGKSASSKSYGITATGMLAERGVVAVDPSFIPLGSKLYIVGYGFAVAADTGPSIKGNKIDLYYETLAEAIQFGRQTVRVYLLSIP